MCLVNTGPADDCLRARADKGAGVSCLRVIWWSFALEEVSLAFGLCLRDVLRLMRVPHLVNHAAACSEVAHGVVSLDAGASILAN